MKKVLLYSGGMDSWLIDKIAKPDVKLFVNIGTASSNAEMLRLAEDVDVVNLRDLGQWERKETDFILPLRNLYLIALATNYGEHIILGANATDATFDKTEDFAAKLEDLLNYMWQPQKWTPGKQIKVDVHFRDYTKSQLLAAYLDEGGSWETAYKESFSCYTPTDGWKECHNCRPCFLKLRAFLDNKVMLPKHLIVSYVPYVQKKLVEFEDRGWGDRLYGKEAYEEILDLAEAR